MVNMYFLILCIISSIPIILSIKIMDFIDISKKNVLMLTVVQILVGIIMTGLFKKNELVIPIMVIVSIIYCLISKKNVLKMIISFILVYISVALLDTIQIFILMSFGHSKEFYVNNQIIYLFMNINLGVFICLLAYGIRCLSEELKLKVNYIKNYKKAVSIIFLNISLLCLMFYCITLIVRYYNIDESLIQFLTGICAIFFIINLGTSYYIIKITQKDFEVKIMSEELKNLKLYTSSLENVNTEVRKFRHDYINIISSMDEYIENEDVDGLRNFFRKNLIPLNDNLNKKNLRIGLLGKIMIPELKSLMVFKVIKAQELGVNINIEIPGKIDEINMDMIDLCRSIGIIMDNAIEAAVEAKKPEINIGVLNTTKTINIIVENSYGGETPLLHEIVKNGYSTKGNNRGMGLHTLGEIIKRHKSVTMDTIIKENKFVQDIAIVK
ncbi:MAG: sensor histidine kinase [Clostridiaceae bacterium]